MTKTTGPWCAFGQRMLNDVWQLFVPRAALRRAARTLRMGKRPFRRTREQLELLVEHTMNHASRFKQGLTESLGPWTHQHSLGAAVVFLLALPIAITIWPGWA